MKNKGEFQQLCFFVYVDAFFFIEQVFQGPLNYFLSFMCYDI